MFLDQDGVIIRSNVVTFPVCGHATANLQNYKENYLDLDRAVYVLEKRSQHSLDPAMSQYCYHKSVFGSCRDRVQKMDKYYRKKLKLILTVQNQVVVQYSLNTRYSGHFTARSWSTIVFIGSVHGLAHPVSICAIISIYIYTLQQWKQSKRRLGRFRKTVEMNEMAHS